MLLMRLLSRAGPGFLFVSIRDAGRFDSSDRVHALCTL
jgi:hypothetical protein